MLKRIAFLLIGILFATSFIGCNKDSEANSDSAIVYSSTLVKSFKIKPNKHVLSALDSVFFSIDLVSAKIFNADSLPYGTKVNKLVVDIATDGCSTVELHVPKADGANDIVDYLTNSTDSIDFSNGPVVLHLVSFDGKSERNYEIKVNVHKVISDSLYWDKTSVKPLPTNLANVKAQKTVELSDKTVCLTSDGSSYCIATSDDLPGDNWTIAAIAPGFNADVNSLAANDSDLFILDKDGNLYQSSDLGANWSATGEKWLTILGAYESSLLGIAENGGKYVHVTYPASSETEIEKEFPVKSTSNFTTLSTVWTKKIQKVFVGGELADGSLSKSIWGYDGNRWAKLGDTFPKPIANASLISFDIAKTDTLSWRTKEIPSLLVVGGITEEGLNNVTYISRDMGMNWRQADKLLQLPDYIAPFQMAQPIVANTLFYASRAVKPITEWECPYIYLFGGYDINGNLNLDVWKGTINRLTFKPLQ